MIFVKIKKKYFIPQNVDFKIIVSRKFKNTSLL